MKLINDSFKGDPFLNFYLRLRQTNNCPLSKSIENFKRLDQETPSDEDLIYCLLEDCIFASLQATYYEEMFMIVKGNPSYGKTLIERFYSQKEERDELIYKQAQLHLNFITKNGFCSGCNQCENHKDVEELMDPYFEGDLDFFIRVYVGMETIYLSLENLFFHYLPHNLNVTNGISREAILKFRSFIFNDATKALEEN